MLEMDAADVVEVDETITFFMCFERRNAQRAVQLVVEGVKAAAKARNRRGKQRSHTFFWSFRCSC